MMKAIKKIMKKIKINKEDVPDNISNNKYNNCWKKINVNEEKKNKENCEYDIECEDVEMKINNF